MGSELVPVFIPPLATVLAATERQRGQALSEADVLAMRDGAAVIMMRTEDAERMTVSRGFRDVDPEDCWADWHRLRVEHTGNGYLPRFVLCVLGDGAFGRTAAPLLEAAGVEHEIRGRDERMSAAFRASSFAANPPLTATDLAAIEGHEAALYLLSANFGAGAALAEARRMLALGGRLLEAGGSAMKCDSAGIAHGREQWRALAEAADETALFRAFVQYPIQDGPDLHSCGLHLLGKPDLISSVLAGGAEEAATLFPAFALYLLLECPPRRFASGHTFQADADSPRYRVRWEPCEGYEEDDYFFNPFGRYRFEGER
jgi:hypothetical protein